MKVVFVKRLDISTHERYLLETPVDIKAGELLLVDSGTKVAAVSPSMEISDNSTTDFAKYHGTILPLSKVVGRYREILERFDKPKEDKPNRKFKVGDRVRIRQWDDMAKEFGIDWDGDISMPPPTFTKDMKYLCGRTATVTEISALDVKLDFDDKSDINYWYYTIYMLESIEDNPEVREVNRIAKTGEYIKIINAYPLYGDQYKNGDIFKVACVVHDNIDIFVDGIGFIFKDEYVVLEGYTDEMYQEYLKSKGEVE